MITKIEIMGELAMEDGRPSCSLTHGVTMDPPPLNPVILPAKEDESPAPRRRSIVRKSALLNIVIVLTSFPVLVYAGGPKVVVPTLKIMAGISVLIWTATFAMSSLATFPRIFRRPVSTVERSDSPHSDEQSGVDERWRD
jgi:hypothetical protein